MIRGHSKSEEDLLAAKIGRFSLFENQAWTVFPVCRYNIYESRVLPAVLFFAYLNPENSRLKAGAQ